MAIYKINDVREAMIGQWQDCLSQLVGMDSRRFNKRHQDCPICGGKDRWRWTDNKGKDERGHGWSFCNSCGAMDGIKLFERLYGEPFNVCVNVLGDWANAIPVEVRQAASQKVADAPEYDYGRTATADACRKLLAYCFDEVYTPLTWEEGIPDLRGYKVRYRGDVADINAEHYICDALQMVQHDRIEADPCNVAKIHPDKRIDFLAGDLTFGAVTQINAQQDGAIYVTVGWCDGYHAAAATGREVWICYVPSNLDHVARRWKVDGRPLRFVCNPDDGNPDVYHALCYAEENGIEVFTPRGGRWSMGLERKPKKAADLLDAWRR